MKKMLSDQGLVAEFVAPRLWENPRTIDGAYTSNDPAERAYALERTIKAIDIANELDCHLMVLWLAREGTYIREAKSVPDSTQYLVTVIDKLLEYDRQLRILIEPKPNEPMDQAYIPTVGHALGPWVPHGQSRARRDPYRDRSPDSRGPGSFRRDGFRTLFPKTLERALE